MAPKRRITPSRVALIRRALVRTLIGPAPPAWWPALAATARNGIPPSRSEQPAASVPAASAFSLSRSSEDLFCAYRAGGRSTPASSYRLVGGVSKGCRRAGPRDRRGNGGGPGGRARWQSAPTRWTGRRGGGSLAPSVAGDRIDRGPDGRGDAAPADQDNAGQTHAG